MNIQGYGTQNLKDIGIVTVPEDDENTAVMQYFAKKIAKQTQNIKMFSIADLQIIYGQVG